MSKHDKPATLEQYVDLILGWAEDRNLIKGSTAYKQLLKTVEEIGETARAINLNDSQGICDGVGDAFVTLVIAEAILGVGKPPMVAKDFREWGTVALAEVLYTLGTALNRLGVCDESRALWSVRDLLTRDIPGLAAAVGIPLIECVAAAWEEIKDRKGRMVDGVFVKEVDL